MSSIRTSAVGLSSAFIEFRLPPLLPTPSTADLFPSAITPLALIGMRASLSTPLRLDLLSPTLLGRTREATKCCGKACFRVTPSGPCFTDTAVFALCSATTAGVPSADVSELDHSTVLLLQLTQLHRILNCELRRYTVSSYLSIAQSSKRLEARAKRESSIPNTLKDPNI